MTDLPSSTLLTPTPFSMSGPVIGPQPDALKSAAALRRFQQGVIHVNLAEFPGSVFSIPDFYFLILTLSLSELEGQMRMKALRASSV